MTDDLDMGAIVNESGLTATIERAMLAGNHLAMICHRVHLIEEARAALEKVDQAALDRALAGVDQFQAQDGPTQALFGRTISRARPRSLGAAVATLGAEAAALRSPDDGKRSPVEIY